VLDDQYAQRLGEKCQKIKRIRGTGMVCNDEFGPDGQVGLPENIHFQQELGIQADQFSAKFIRNGLG
jgi:hypothetical protein